MSFRRGTFYVQGIAFTGDPDAALRYAEFLAERRGAPLFIKGNKPLTLRSMTQT